MEAMGFESSSFLLSFGVVFSFCLLSFILFVFVPAHNVVGYATENGRPLLYRLNGLRILLLLLFLSFLPLPLPLSHLPSLIFPSSSSSPPSSPPPFSFFYTHYWECVFSSFLIGLLLSVVIFFINFQGKSAPKREEALKKAKEDPSILLSLENFFFGKTLSPRFSFPFSLSPTTPPSPSTTQVDIKMFLYVVGAVLLCVNVLAFVDYHLYLRGGEGATNGVLVYVFMMMWFLIDYMYHEHVHLYTYDLVDENVGFKLIWGCFCFYPFFYLIGLFPLIPALSSIPQSSLFLSLFTFLSGYFLSRGANNQKYFFKLDFPSKKNCFWGLVEQRGIEVGEGEKGGEEKKKRYVLCSGFWGLSRHINYLGEILMAIGLSIPGGHFSYISWFYPIYYILLLFPRERDDNERCQKRYGKAWTKYCEMVPYRIIPYIY